MVAMKGINLVAVTKDVLVRSMKARNLRKHNAHFNSGVTTTFTELSNEFFVFRENRSWRRLSF